MVSKCSSSVKRMSIIWQLCLSSTSVSFTQIWTMEKKYLPPETPVEFLHTNEIIKGRCHYMKLVLCQGLRVLYRHNLVRIAGKPGSPRGGRFFSCSWWNGGGGHTLRRYDGSVIFAAYRFLSHCNDALETEIHALMQGMTLTIHHSEGPTVA